MIVRLRQFWTDHSLTIVIGTLGLGFVLVAMPLREGNWFDLWLGLGHGCLTVAFLNALAGRLRERNKPDE